MEVSANTIFRTLLNGFVPFHYDGNNTYRLSITGLQNRFTAIITNGDPIRDLIRSEVECFSWSLQFKEIYQIYFTCQITNELVHTRTGIYTLGSFLFFSNKYGL